MFSLYVDLRGVKGWRFLPREIHAAPQLLEARIASPRECVILHLPGENIVVLVERRIERALRAGTKRGLCTQL